MVATSLIGAKWRKTSKRLLKKTNSATGLGVDEYGTKESYSKFKDEWGIRPVPPLPDAPIFDISTEGAKKCPTKML